MKKAILIPILIFLLYPTFSIAQNWGFFSNDNAGPGGVLLTDSTSQEAFYVASIFGVNSKPSVTAKWDGTAFSSLGDASKNCIDFPCIGRSLAYFRNQLYLGGQMDEIDGVTINNIARWDTTKWSALNNGVTGRVYNIYTYKDQLYISGTFYLNINGAPYYNLLKWTGTSLKPVINTAYYYSDTIYQPAGEYQGKLIFVGNFKSIDTIPAKKIATYDGLRWQKFPVQPNLGNKDIIYGIAVKDKELWAYGSIATINGDSAYNIIRFDGSKWQAMGKNTKYDRIGNLKMVNNKIFILGKNTSNQNLNCISIWDSTNSSWKSFGKGLLPSDMNNTSHGDIIFLNNKYIVSGIFDIIKNGNRERTSLTVLSNTSDIENSDLSVGRNIEVYPNPFEQETTISVKNIASGKTILLLTNSLGQIILDKEINTNGEHSDFTIHKSDLPASGVYFYTVTTSTNEVYRGKIIFTN